MSHRKILVVDDDIVSLHLLNKIASTLENTSVVMAINGRMAFEIMCFNQFDLVITDFQMPEMDGLELTKSIRSNYPQTPVILCTAYGDIGTIRRASEIGAFDFFTKPLVIGDFKNAIEIALSFGGSQQLSKNSLAAQKQLQKRAQEVLAKPIDGFDKNILNSLIITLSHQSVSDIVGKFKNQAMKDINSMQISLNQKDVEKTKSLAFQMQGSAAAMGFLQVKFYASKLTEIASIEDANAEFLDLKRVYLDGLKELESYLKSASI